MFKLFIKNFNLSLVFLLCLLQINAIDFKFPKKISGTFHGALYLKNSINKVYTLSHIIDKEATYTYRWFLNSPQNQINIELSSRGNFTIVVNNSYKKISSTFWTKKKLNFIFSQKQNHIDLKILFHKNEDAEVEKVTIDKASHDFDSLTKYQKQKPFKVKSLKINRTIGVNLEAEYLFSELLKKQWILLIRQLKRDGFNSIRLHKVYREYQKKGDVVLKQLEGFLELCDKYNLSIYLDILSYPKSKTTIDGWKQSIYLDSLLQEKMTKWILSLSKIRVLKKPFFEWENLKFICLLNENSLFFESNKKSKNTLNNLLLKSRTKKWITRESFKIKLMKNLYNKFLKSLRDLGYKGIIFLSNYQLGGKDLKINKDLSAEVDRHLYLDYPLFFKSFVKVKNENPIESLIKLKEHFFKISPVEGTYISEFNLPWPNRFQHTLIPTLLFLNYYRKIKGLWFYDYRLRNDSFHGGGIFGIQKFRSIISQLPYFFKLLKGNYQIEQKQNQLVIQSNDFISITSMIFLRKTEFHFTAWKSCKTNKFEIFGFERAIGDEFDSMGQIQLMKGKGASEIIFPIELIKYLKNNLNCYSK
ncbi:MAG: hypothetical protein COB02_01625 [Candidatus Cloacimonadota bacterium]|nr:MAG: hypothetical protein COB02_01625 [Candidatus Cloacimonadota bacterium]